MKQTMVLLLVLACVMLLGFAAQPHGQTPAQPPEALTGFDNLSNGFSDPDRHTADQTNFEEVEHIAPDGLGPIYNAQSCRECHQTPVSGAASQVMEVRVGHLLHGQFQNPAIPIDDGKEVITGRTLVNDRAICPQIQEHVPATETIRTTRLATNVLGDGYVEAISDATLLKIRSEQCRASHGKICGQAIYVPVPPSEGNPRIGRFGWKDQHASLLFFAGDAYLNEMGITNSLEPDEVTAVCNPPVTTANPNNDPTKVTEPNSLPSASDNNLEDIDHFASFMRSLKAPARDDIIAATAQAKHGQELFVKIGCATCHVETIVSGKSPAVPGGPGLHLDAVENRTLHPYSDFLLHNVGTGDGISVALVEHYGKQRMAKLLGAPDAASAEQKRKAAVNEAECSVSFQDEVMDGKEPADLARDMECARNKIRTAPLWGLRLRSRLMHDGVTLTVVDAIHRHKGEAEEVEQRFRWLKPSDQQALLTFLQSL